MRPTQPGLPLAVGLAAVIAMLAAGATAMVLLLDRPAPPPPLRPANLAHVDTTATETAAGQISAAMQAVFTFRHGNLGEHQRTMSQYLTGDALGQVTQLAGEARDLTVQATVRETAVKTLTGDRAEALVILSQSFTAKADPQPRTSAAQIHVTAALTGQRWMITGIRVL